MTLKNWLVWHMKRHASWRQLGGKHQNYCLCSWAKIGECGSSEVFLGGGCFGFTLRSVVVCVSPKRNFPEWRCMRERKQAREQVYREDNPQLWIGWSTDLHWQSGVGWSSTGWMAQVCSTARCGVVGQNSLLNSFASILVFWFWSFYCGLCKMLS